jgi:hypothetical protein
MKGKLLAVVLLAAVGVSVLLYATRAQANIGPELTVETVFSALNSGDVDTALASFSVDAVAEHRIRGERYEGLSEIRLMLEKMFKNGRRFDIVGMDTDGDQVIVLAEISDGGMVWGTETIAVELKNGKVQSFSVTAVRLELWKIYRKR